MCPGCSELLNYRSKKREVKRLKRSQKKSKKSKMPESEESEDEEELLLPGTPEEPVEPSTSAEAEAVETDEASLWKMGLYLLLQSDDHLYSYSPKAETLNVVIVRPPQLGDPDSINYAVNNFVPKRSIAQPNG